VVVVLEEEGEGKQLVAVVFWGLLQQLWVLVVVVVVVVPLFNLVVLLVWCKG
jgi:hypothetical protein